MPDTYVWLTVAVIALITAALRFLPFLIFKSDSKTPKIIQRLSAVLPYAIMGMLVVYCLKDTNISSVSGFLPALISSAIVAGLYVWRRNTLLSIISGTVCYMLMVQLIF